MIITLEFYNWILPLLEYPEDKILLHHIRKSRNGFELKQKSKARRNYGVTRRKLYVICAWLEWLAKLYELEAVAFPEHFS